MRISVIRVSLVAALSAAAFSVAGISEAQGRSPAVTNSMTTQDGDQANRELTEKYLREGLGDPKEEAAYQAFHKAEEDGDKKIHLGIAFLTKYPSDRYTEAVYEELSQTYYDRKDLSSFYMYS